jgi:phage gpG-like protein
VIGTSIKIEDFLPKVEAAAEKTTFRNLAHGVAAIRKTAIASIEKSEVPSQPGEPPHTRRGQLPRAIVFDVGTDSAVVGPRHSVVDEAGAAHEFGEEFRDTDFPERAYMGPALQANVDRFAANWSGSIGE